MECALRAQICWTPLRVSSGVRQCVACRSRPGQEPPYGRLRTSAACAHAQCDGQLQIDGSAPPNMRVKV